MVRGTFSPARAWRPAVVARLPRTLGLANIPIPSRCDTELDTQHRRELESMKIQLAIASILLSVSMAGCSAIAEVAYDDAVQRERVQCEKLVSMLDRQTCMQRVNTAKRQADEQRKK